MSDDDQGPDLEAGIDVEQMKDRPLMAGTYRGEPVVLVRDDDRYCAWSGQCTHLKAQLAEGRLVDGQLRCPWHHARFSLATGEAVAAPAFQPLTRFAVETRDGRVFVVAKESPRDAEPTASATTTRIVIVGGGAAGHACAEWLARHGAGRSVTLIGDDADPPYDRTFCSKQYLIGMVSRAACSLDDGSSYGPDGPVRRVAARVASLDTVGRKVVFADGGTVAYDRLVLATGAEAGRPDLPGFDRPEVHVLRTLGDADALIAAAESGKRGVVIGASFVGLEAAASLTQRHVAIDVVAHEAIPLEKIVGAAVGTMIRKVHEEHGVRFHLGRRPASFDGRRLTLDDGSTIDADFVVLGVGVTPRTGLAEEAGLDVASRDDGGGVIVDDHLRTSVADIYAIGDIARYPDRHAGKPLRVEHWVHAERQGQFVARALLGADEPYDDLPFFWSAHFDTGLRYLGHVDAIERSDVDGSVEGRDFTVRYVDDRGGQAFATCNRDLPALDVEAAWEASPAT